MSVEADLPARIETDFLHGQGDLTTTICKASVKAAFASLAELAKVALPHQISFLVATCINAGGDVFAETAIASPITRRTFHWLKVVAEGLEELDQTFDVESERFQTVFIRATRAAVATHQAEKIRALRNAVLNVAAASVPPGAEEEWLLILTEDLTPDHLNVLSLAAEPDAWCRRRNATLTSYQQKQEALPELVEAEFRSDALGPYYFQSLVVSLESQGLIHPLQRTYNGGIEMNAGWFAGDRISGVDKLQAHRITPLGRQLYLFILEEPGDSGPTPEAKTKQASALR